MPDDLNLDEIERVAKAMPQSDARTVTLYLISGLRGARRDRANLIQGMKERNDEVLDLRLQLKEARRERDVSGEQIKKTSRILLGQTDALRARVAELEREVRRIETLREAGVDYVKQFQARVKELEVGLESPRFRHEQMDKVRAARDRAQLRVKELEGERDALKDAAFVEGGERDDADRDSTQEFNALRARVKELEGERDRAESRCLKELVWKPLAQAHGERIKRLRGLLGEAPTVLMACVMSAPGDCGECEQCRWRKERDAELKPKEPRKCP